jgi:hypothetical protein
MINSATFSEITGTDFGIPTVSGGSPTGFTNEYFLNITDNGKFCDAKIYLNIENPVSATNLTFSTPISLTSHQLLNSLSKPPTTKTLQSLDFMRVRHTRTWLLESSIKNGR